MLLPGLFGEYLSVLPVLEKQQFDGMETADRLAADRSDVVVDARQVRVGYDRGDVLSLNHILTISWQHMDHH